MSKERLEEIKEVFDIQKIQTFADRESIPFNLSDIGWLIEQAEKKQLLETTIDFYESALRDADRRVQELERANKQLERQAPGIELELLNMELTDALKQNKRYREAIGEIRELLRGRTDSFLQDEVDEIIKAMEGEKK